MDYSKVENSLVTTVIVADQSFIDSGALGDPSLFYLTDFYTRGGVHYGVDGQPDGLPPFRGNYGETGYTYDSVNDVFYAPQPYPSWTISAPTWIWQPPVPYPSTGGPYTWDEATQTWITVV